jgi:class 3 adenylate cyclase/pimeloyl-ACP methyl ester carboxylesterase
MGTERRTATISVLFCDLVASTERQQRLGDDAADGFRHVVFGALYDAAGATRGEVVKSMGDGLMVVFRDSAVDAVACASRMHDSVETLDVAPPAHLRVGVSAGEAASENDDWYGTPVIEAARLCALADAGQTLVSDVVRALVGSRGGHSLRPLGPMTLKGIADPVPVCTVNRAALLPPPSSPTRTQSKRRRHRWIVALTALAIAAGAIAFASVPVKKTQATTAAVRYEPRIEAAACSEQVQTSFRNAQCGVLLVPEDRSRPEGRWIRVSFTRYPARHSLRDDPVIEVATALDNAEILDDPAQSPVRDDADLIVFGGRGLASSVPSLTCPEFATIAPEMLRYAQDDAPTIAKTQAALRACHDRLVKAGVALGHYTTLDEADDVVDLIHALHLRDANLQGVWDGARVALAVARQAPEVVRSMFLLDPEAPRSSFMENPTASLASAFDRYVALCEADKRCHAAYPNLAQAFREAVVVQNARPTTTIPIDVISGVLRVSVKHPPVRVDGKRLSQGLAAAFTSSLRNMPLLAAGIEHPDATVDASLALAQNFPLVIKDFAWGGFLSRMCSYEIYTRSAGASVAATTRPEFAGYDDPTLGWMCAAWNVPREQQAAFAPVSIDVPTFVVELGLDPRNLPDAVTQLRAGVRHLTVLSFATLPGGALPGDFPACYGDVRREFVKVPERPLDGESCARQSPRIDFVVPTS